MRFTSRFNNHTIVVRARQHATPSSPADKGLAAKFRAPTKQVTDPERRQPVAFFDSEAAQKDLGWTKAELEEVERAVLTNRKFGNGVYLAPGQEIPARYRDLFPDVEENTPADVVAPEVEPELICANVEMDDDGELRQCQNPPLKGTDLCAKHTPVVEEIPAGHTPVEEIPAAAPKPKGGRTKAAK
jgi:hypothetical protein